MGEETSAEIHISRRGAQVSFGRTLLTRVCMDFFFRKIWHGQTFAKGGLINKTFGGRATCPRPVSPCIRIKIFT